MAPPGTAPGPKKGKLTSRELLKQRLNELTAQEGNKFLSKTICVLELPFIVDEADVRKFFAVCDGGIKRIEIHRSGALVFSSAIIEFNKQKGAKKALELATRFSGDFDVIIVEAQDFLDNADLKIRSNHEESSSTGGAGSSQSAEQKKDDCTVQ